MDSLGTDWWLSRQASFLSLRCCLFKSCERIRSLTKSILHVDLGFGLLLDENAKAVNIYTRSGLVLRNKFLRYVNERGMCYAQRNRNLILPIVCFIVGSSI